MLSKLIAQIFRIVVGGLFIFSGFVKLVDPLGSAYKFEEYFGADVLNLEFLIPYALIFSIILIVIELLLGIALLIGFKTKLTLWSLLGITTLFLFLTWYSAYYNKVTDCGCFGDAVKLSPWETFYKNVFFIGFILILFFLQKHIKPFLDQKVNHWVMLLALTGCLYTCYYALAHLPVIDFRAYAVGKNLRKGMEYNDDGEIPPIHDFYLESETEDLTEIILDAPKVLLISIYDLRKTNHNNWDNIKEIVEKAKKQNYLVYGLSSSSSDLVNETIAKYQLNFNILFCDGTALKTMIRSNPGFVFLERSVVKAKFSIIDVNKIKL